MINNNDSYYSYYILNSYYRLKLYQQIHIIQTLYRNNSLVG